MVKCVLCQESAADMCRRIGKLCGKCCQPRCCPGVHNNRRNGRGKRGIVAKEQKWNKVWRLVHAKTSRMFKHVPFRRYQEQTNITAGAVRYTFRRTLHKMMESDGGEIDDIPDEVAMTMFPADLDDVVASLKMDMSATEGGRAGEHPQCSKAGIGAERRDESVGEAVAAESSRDRHQHEGTDGELECSRRFQDSDAFASQSTLRKSSSGVGPAAQRRDPKGLRAVDRRGHACPHYRRCHPHLHRLSYAHTSMAQPILDGTNLYEHADVLLTAWLKQRSGLLDRVSCVEEKEYIWAPRAGENAKQVSALHAWGKYYYCPLKEWVPRARIDINTVIMYSTLHQDYLGLAIHAGSMYTVHTIVEKGFDGSHEGEPCTSTSVYAHAPFGYARAVSNAGYAVYSSIGGAFVAGPRFELAVEYYRAGHADIGRISAGMGQLCLKEGMFFLRGVWFHILARSDVERGPPTCCQWDEWHPEFEIPVE